MSITKTSIARATVLFVSLSITMLVSTGCNTIRLRTQVKKLMSSTIVLPEKVVRIDGEEVMDMPDSSREKAKLIVYVDLENAFMERNPAVNRDVRLHAFLVNKQGNPVLVGDPVFVPEIEELLGQVIRQLE